MLLINVCATFLFDLFCNPIHTVVLHFLINLSPGSVAECPPSFARKVAIRPTLCTIEEVSEEEERAEELNWDDSYEEEDDGENGLDETTLFPHPNAEDNGTTQKPPLADTNVHTERTSLQVEHSGVSVGELTVCQPKCPDTATRRRQRRNWKDVSRLSQMQQVRQPEIRPPVMRMNALCNPEKRGPTPDVGAMEKNAPWQSEVKQTEGGSAVEYAPPIARKVAVKPTLYTIEEVSEDEERAEEINWDESYEEEDDEEKWLDEATLVSHPNAENNSTTQKPPLTDTNFPSERTSLRVEHSSMSVAELAACQPTCTDTAARRRQRRNWKDVSRLSLFNSTVTNNGVKYNVVKAQDGAFRADYFITIADLQSIYRTHSFLTHLNLRSAVEMSTIAYGHTLSIWYQERFAISPEKEWARQSLRDLPGNNGSFLYQIPTTLPKKVRTLAEATEKPATCDFSIGVEYLPVTRQRGDDSGDLSTAYPVRIVTETTYAKVEFPSRGHETDFGGGFSYCSSPLTLDRLRSNTDHGLRSLAQTSCSPQTILRETTSQTRLAPDLRNESPCGIMDIDQMFDSIPPSWDKTCDHTTFSVAQQA
nr:unnamed protein product [Spirometra erinaceieuropaei]